MALTWIHPDFMVPYEGFSQDCSRDLSRAHTSFPPAELLSRSELLFGGVYPCYLGHIGKLHHEVSNKMVCHHPLKYFDKVGCDRYRPIICCFCLVTSFVKEREEVWYFLALYTVR